MLREEACSTDGSVPGLNAPAGKRWAIPTKLDHDNTAKKFIKFSRSNVFMDARGDGLLHRTAWAGAGDGVLFCAANGNDLISEKREYIFTEWDPTATSDLEALRAAFDTNGDDKLTSADAAFGQFKVMVTNADCSLEAKTLAKLGITEINLNGDAPHENHNQRQSIFAT